MLVPTTTYLLTYYLQHPTPGSICNLCSIGMPTLYWGARRTMDVRPVRPRAASLPARLELAPQFLSSTFGPRNSYSGAPEAAPKRQASPAPAASPAKKSSGARAWSPYHAYCKA